MLSPTFCESNFSFHPKTQKQKTTLGSNKILEPSRQQERELLSAAHKYFELGSSGDCTIGGRLSGSATATLHYHSEIDLYGEYVDDQAALNELKDHGVETKTPSAHFARMSRKQQETCDENQIENEIDANIPNESEMGHLECTGSMLECIGSMHVLDRSNVECENKQKALQC